MRYCLPIALLILVPCYALASTPASPNYPLLDYQPVLRDYQPYQEGELRDWQAVNELVGRLGGHSGHTRQAADVHDPPAHPTALEPGAHESKKP